MSFIRFYRYQKEIVIPTVMQADSSFYFDSEPVVICDVEAKEELRQELTRHLEAGNKVVEIPEAADKGESVILNSLNIKRWFQFEKESTMFMVHHDKDYFKINVTAHHKETGLWTHDIIGERKLPATKALKEVVDMILRIIEEDVKEEERLKAKENEPKPLRLLPPPPPSSNSY